MSKTDTAMTFEQFAMHALTYDELNILAHRPEGVTVHIVMGLAHQSYMTSVYTNEGSFHKYEPSDIGEQFGYIDSDNTAARRFAGDSGLLPEKRHNRHLVFLDHQDAINYFHYQLGSRNERTDREAFLERWSDRYRMWDMDMDVGYDYDYDDGYED